MGSAVNFRLILEMRSSFILRKECVGTNHCEGFDSIHKVMGLLDKLTQKMGEGIAKTYIKHNDNFRYLVDNGYCNEDELMNDIIDGSRQTTVAQRRAKQAETLRSGAYSHTCDSCKYHSGNKCYFRSSGNPGYDRNRGSEYIKIGDPYSVTCDCYEWDWITPNP